MNLFLKLHNTQWLLIYKKNIFSLYWIFVVLFLNSLPWISPLLAYYSAICRYKTKTKHYRQTKQNKLTLTWRFCTCAHRGIAAILLPISLGQQLFNHSPSLSTHWRHTYFTIARLFPARLTHEFMWHNVLFQKYFTASQFISYIILHVIFQLTNITWSVWG